MPPKMNNGGFVSFRDCKFSIGKGAGGADWFDYLPDNWSESVTVSADPDETRERPVYGDWTFSIQMQNPIGRKGAAQILTGNKHTARKVLRHMEWWRRYALKTGTKEPEMFQSVLEVTGRAWRPKMPKGGSGA